MDEAKPFAQIIATLCLGATDTPKYEGTHPIPAMI
jgi:hypothetical protein